MLSHQSKSRNPRNIRTLHPSDAREVAQLHRRCLPDDFLPSLGLPILTVMYKHLLLQKETHAFEKKKKKGLTGFIVGSTNRHRFIKQVILSSWWEITPHVVIKVLQNPMLIGSFIQTLFYGHADTEKTKSELIAICIDDTDRGKGIGKMLLQTLLKSLRISKDKEIIINVYATNKRANSFYIKNKGEHINTFTLYGKKWNSYKMPL